MLFNSYEFVFGFLPVALLLFLLLERRSKNAALGWLIVASLFFYAWWRPVNVFIIAPAVVINYVIARALGQMTDSPSRGWANALLVAGIVFNLLFLGYFKYVNFVRTAINDVAGTDLVLTELILPLGISFITFQKIAFLVDVHGGRVRSFTLRDFCLFVLFFPQLIAGPIVHYGEMMPQFRDQALRSKALDISIGLTLFSFGMFKKAVLADGIAAHVSPLYELAATGGGLSLFQAWTAALGFTLQIYFDFSGYSDMAIGLARCFGIKLPLNFNSPLKASSIVDFWLRWHVTLTRFLTAYLYNPIVLWRTRRRLAKGLPGLGVRNASAGAFLELLAIPTVFTMFVSGLWHGAGYAFILWGVLHGGYIVVNHAWRRFAQTRWKDKQRYARFMQPIGWVLTFLAVVVGMVLFRSPTVGTAGEILSGMLGANGITLPRELLAAAGVTDLLAPIVRPDNVAAGEFVVTSAWVIGLLGIALLLPNTLQLMAKYEPALGDAYKRIGRARFTRILEWTPSLPWLAAVAALAGVTILRLGGPSEFLYWQF